MMLRRILSVFTFVVSTLHAAEICFDELGCFSDHPPWGGTAQRPVAAVPWQPEEIGTQFLLFTQMNQYYQEIKPDETIEASNYGGKRKTRFVIPGYLLKQSEDWPQSMCKVLVQRENVNCIAVEWKKGVKTRYAQAANNARVVAAQVASMITFLMGHYEQTADKFHIIGHSLGAHIAGEAGNRIPGLARISGLDPAEPYFEGTDASVRLDTSDATFVDVIHTDGLPFNSKLGLGMTESVGHIDFYPNGGELMPGCSANNGRPTDLDSIWEGTTKFDGCNHARAYEYYTESISKAQGFVGFPCSNKDSFSAGKCFPCAESLCPLMGHSADKHTLSDEVSKTKYFLNTGRSKPFARYSYKVNVMLDGPSWPNLGFMFVALAGKKYTTKEFQLHGGTLISGKVYDLLIDAEVDVGEVKEVKFRWNNHIVNPLKPRYGASKIELQRGKDKQIITFCGQGNVAENDIQSVLPCQV
ncbi:inactive pancreatic lipase-related protein 1 [Nematolebias whitei]|uniref:inactive pancreatic lipase-related protein 1 n=1 Tax=Nematolebias whitei TaxID=451745 RepID=UPI001896F3F2|nr:inactive pancreatic lipase-related protein 1 [Nematolebias whitei]